MASLIKVNGDISTIFPKSGKSFMLYEVQKILNCRFVDTIELFDGRIMIIDDEGKFNEDHEVNLPATILFREGRMGFHELKQYLKKLSEEGTHIIDAREIQGEDYIAGDVIVCDQENFV